MQKYQGPSWEDDEKLGETYIFLSLKTPLGGSIPNSHRPSKNNAPAGPVEDPSPTIQELEVASPRAANLGQVD